MKPIHTIDSGNFHVEVYEDKVVFLDHVSQDIWKATWKEIYRLTKPAENFWCYLFGHKPRKRYARYLDWSDCKRCGQTLKDKLPNEKSKRP